MYTNLLKKWLGPILIVFLSFVVLVPLIYPGLPATHDGLDHVARIANFYQSLTEGNVVPRWAGNLNWGYGHPILMFLYPLSSYLASLFHFLGFSFVESTKLVFGAAFILSGLTMYLWLRELLDENSAVVGALLYNFAPYRFVDVYVRGAIGENMAFVFPPLVFYYLLKISKSDSFNRYYFVFASFSFAGLVLAHNAISLMFIPLIIFYGVYLFFINKKKKSLSYQYLAIIILGFALSAFFVLPAFLEGKYTLRDIVTNGLALERFVDFKSLLYSPWSFRGSTFFSVQVGLLQWIGVIAFPVVLYYLFYRKEKNLILYVFVFLTFWASIFIMLPISESLWKFVTTLQKFQFPWRFLSVSVFSSAILFSFLVYIFPKYLQKIFLILIVIIMLLINYDYWQPTDYHYNSESYYSGVYKGTTDTGESSPIWSVRFMEHTASASAEVLKGSAVITPLTRSSTRHTYDINAEFRTRVRENTLYFPGWRIYIDGKLYPGVQFQDPESRGLMTYYVPTGKHRVDVIFGDTRLRTISNYISLGALLLVIGILLNTFKTKSITGNASVKRNKGDNLL